MGGAPFRDALLAVPPRDRDAWLDRTLGTPLLDDGPALPKDCVPYLPSSVDVLLRMIDGAEIRASDVFVDVGSGIGRAAALVHLFTGATAIGLEIQPELVTAAKALAVRLGSSGLTFTEADAGSGSSLPPATVFFLYCPFSGARLERMLAGLQAQARERLIRVCCVDLPLPACSWLTRVREEGDLTVYRSVSAAPSLRLGRVGDSPA